MATEPVKTSVSPAPNAEQKAPEVKTLTADEQKSLAGELKAGIGFVSLDPTGKPSAATEKPDATKPSAAVVRVNPREDTVLMTPSGAAITDNMQPHPHANKYNSPAYKRDYAAIAEAVAKRDGLEMTLAK